MTASLGLGTYRVPAVEEVARTACADGSVWIDTAPNYADAHQVLARVIAAHPQARVATKTGFFTRPEGEAALQAGLLTPDQAGAGHSLDPAFVRWQTERSLTSLGRADLVFLHNPERARPGVVDLPAAMREAFTVLEGFAVEGRIGGYGVATWSGFSHHLFNVPELLGLAEEAAGSGEHHLRAIQQPISLVMARPVALALDGRGPLFQARAAGLITFGSSPLHGGELPHLVTPELAEFISPGASPAAACLVVAASCPSLDVVLLSARTAHHWATARAAIASPLDPIQLRKVTDVLAQG
ncbi:aldo/keto reductase [Streptomyces sp. NPDC101145]|uniref:aldo/keto reductase n=1 Tax=Streptomyces sp. NPDC101145 TaxID=3366112 RepID=UPI00380CE9A0